MRLDLFLKKTCILKSRAAAKDVCDAGAATVNGRTAKGSQELRAGDVVQLQLLHRQVELRVLEVPGGNVAKRDIPRYVVVLRDEPRERFERFS